MSKWRTYEWLVYNYYCNICNQYNNDWEVTYNKKIQGYSGIKRECKIICV